jgi:hypothetical protein
VFLDSQIFSSQFYFAGGTQTICIDLPAAQNPDVGFGDGTTGVSKIRGPIVATCLAGDTITASIWFHQPTGLGFDYRWVFTGLDDNANLNLADIWTSTPSFSTTSASGTWVELARTIVVPADAWVRAELQTKWAVSGSGLHTEIYDLDDITITTS